MQNLAGNKECDKFILEELELAGIKPVHLSFASRDEVPASVIGELDGWEFRRAWYYWVAKSHSGTLLLFKYADPLHEKHGKDVRVSGYCGGIAPREWYKFPFCIGVDSYHVDSVIGLKALADAIKQQTADNQEGV